MRTRIPAHVMEKLRFEILFSALALWMVCSGLVWPVRCEDQDDAHNLVRSMETTVVVIAQSASQNYDDSCGGTIGNCQAERDCSKLQCFPSQGQTQQRDVYVNGSATRCYGQAAIQCSRASADFTKSMIRLPGSPTVTYTDSELGSLETAFGSTICAQRVLDATFLTHSISNPENNFVFSLFFGAADGVLRFYPGRHESVPSICTPYDPRTRPWYIDAISVKKDVVILLDTGAAMSRKDLFWSISSWEIEKILTKTFLQTLTPVDTFAVFTVNSTGSFALYGPVAFNGSTESTKSFVSVLDNLVLDVSEDSNPSNFRAGFQMAVSSDPFTNTTGDALKVVLLFTDSSGRNVPPGDLANSTLAPIQAEGVGVFVYDLKQGGGNSTLWSSALCHSELKYESQPQNLRLQAKENPLLFLNGYFSFQARARSLANGGSLISWTKPDSASDPGRVVTVAYPAMSEDGSVLVGVAGVDVQTACLPPNMQSAILSLLSSATDSRYATIPTVPSFKENLSTCFKEYSNSCRGHQKSASYLPICTSKIARQNNLEFPMSLFLVLGTAVVVLSILLSTYILLRSQIFYGRQKFSRHSIRYKTLLRCANDFDSCSVIGEGEFGTVYRGRLGNDSVVVKRLKHKPDRAVDFQSESRAVRISCSHPNLVTLKGTCFRDRACFVVYEYVEGGNLESRLELNGNPVNKEEARSRANARFLTWDQRKQIARGVARGLDFLHRGSPTGQILHLNLKPRNILLDRSCDPRIADFGICQLYEPNHAYSIAASSSTRGGSMGYTAPEVMQISPVPTSKLDVFSYGVVLMQLVTGRRVDDERLRPCFLQWARNLATSHDADLELAIDERLLESVAPESRENLIVDCKNVLKIALDCTDERAHMRPEMITILERLDDFQDVREVVVPYLGDGSNNEENRVTSQERL